MKRIWITTLVFVSVAGCVGESPKELNKQRLQHYTEVATQMVVIGCQGLMGVRDDDEISPEQSHELERCSFGEMMRLVNTIRSHDEDGSGLLMDAEGFATTNNSRARAMNRFELVKWAEEKAGKASAISRW